MHFLISEGEIDELNNPKHEVLRERNLLRPKKKL